MLKQSTEGVSRALAAKLREFEKHKMEDALNRKLANRPSRERLVEMNLLRGENVSPALYTKQQELAKRAIEDKLNKKLAARPTKEELVEQHKLVGAQMTSAMIARARCLTVSVRTQRAIRAASPRSARFSAR